VGAAPTLIPDAILEFSLPGAAIALYGIGYLYARCWRKAVETQGIWLINYVVLAAVSVFLISQGLTAPMHIYLLTMLPMALFWRFYIERRSRSAGAPDPPALGRGTVVAAGK
jgi:hypothetical protein